MEIVRSARGRLGPLGDLVIDHLEQHHRCVGDGVKTALMFLKHFMAAVGFDGSLTSSQRCSLLQEMASFRRDGLPRIRRRMLDLSRKM